MKKFIVFAFLFAIASISVAQIITPDDNQSQGGNNSNVNFGAPQQAPNKFNSDQEALNAPYTTGFQFYEPSYLSGKGRNPVDGVTKVALPLEEDAIVKMAVVGGIYWVWLRKGTLARFYVNQAGAIAETPYALDACGNSIYAMKYVTRVPVEQNNLGQIEIEQNQSVRFNNTPVYAQSQTRQIQMPTTYQMETRQFQQAPPCNPCQDEQLNYYSQKLNSPVMQPNQFTYEHPVDYGYQPKVRQGMPKAVKWVIRIAAGVGTYYLVSSIAKNKTTNRQTTNSDGSSNGGQVVQTLPSTTGFTPPPGLGVGFTIGF